MATTEQQRRWRQKKASNGMARFEAWVPADRVDGLKAIIADCIADPTIRLIGVRRRDGILPTEHPHANDDGRPGEVPEVVTRNDVLEAVACACFGLDDSELLAVCDLIRVLVNTRD